MRTTQQYSNVVPALMVAALALLVACGGGGPSPVPSGGSTPAPVSSDSPGPVTTNASGVVVDDTNGNPLAGVRVVLMPWGPCGATPAPASITPENDGCPTPLPSPQATTNPSGQFTLNGAPNGHYLLVIGTDTVATPPPGYTLPSCTTSCGVPTPVPFTVQATVHDNVTLTGGNQTLIAPILPPVPTITPAPWEINGEFRLATLDASTEMPCLVAWQYLRIQHGLAEAVPDEWLVENTRSIDDALQSAAGQNAFGFPVTVADHVLIGGQVSQVLGGSSCDIDVDQLAFTAATTQPVYDPRTLWYGGQYAYYSEYGGSNNEAVGLAEFPVDPRSYTDPNVPNWP